MDEDAFDASCDQLVLLVVEMGEVHSAELIGVEHGHNITVLIHENELKQGCDHQVQLSETKSQV